MFMVMGNSNGTMGMYDGFFVQSLVCFHINPNEVVGSYLLSCRYPYITVVMNFSQMWALYCLVQFYDVTHERLRPIKPLAKFISFKAIVFATWWQGVGIALLCAYGVLPKHGKMQTALQDFLICIEVSCS